MNNSRWIDIAKGLGIISVVAGHTFGGNIKNLIFLFHMPLFFFIGGYLFKIKPDFKLYLRSKITHLLIPYSVYLIFLYFPYEFLNIDEWNSKEILSYLARPIIGGELLIGPVGVFWFVTCYFITQQIFNLLINKCNNTILYITISAFLLFSYGNSMFFPQFWLPWNINIVFAALPLFFIGYIFKKNKISYPLYINLIIVTISIFVSIYLGNNTYDMKYGEYGIPFFTLISSVSIIILIKKVSVFISRYKKASFILSEIGNASMTIMYLHLPVRLFILTTFNFNSMTTFILSTAIPIFIHWLFFKFRITKLLFLGLKTDIKVSK